MNILKLVVGIALCCIAGGMAGATKSGKTFIYRMIMLILAHFGAYFLLTP